MVGTKLLLAGFAAGAFLAAPGAGAEQPGPGAVAQAGKPAQAAARVQEFEMLMNVWPPKFSPDPLTVKKGIPLKLRMRALQREHLNQLSIRPFVTNVTLEPPGKVTVIEFTPTQGGTFKIRNLGHDFEGTLIVVE